MSSDKRKKVKKPRKLTKGEISYGNKNSTLNPQDDRDPALIQRVSVAPVSLPKLNLPPAYED